MTTVFSIKYKISSEFLRMTPVVSNLPAPSSSFTNLFFLLHLYVKHFKGKDVYNPLNYTSSSKLSTRVRAFNSVPVDFRTVEDDHKQHVNVFFGVT